MYRLIQFCNKRENGEETSVFSSLARRSEGATNRVGIWWRFSGCPASSRLRPGGSGAPCTVTAMEWMGGSWGCSAWRREGSRSRGGGPGRRPNPRGGPDGRGGSPLGTGLLQSSSAPSFTETFYLITVCPLSVCRWLGPRQTLSPLPWPFCPS